MAPSLMEAIVHVRPKKKSTFLDDHSLLCMLHQLMPNPRFNSSIFDLEGLNLECSSLHLLNNNYMVKYNGISGCGDIMNSALSGSLTKSLNTEDTSMPDALKSNGVSGLNRLSISQKTFLQVNNNKPKTPDDPLIMMCNVVAPSHLMEKSAFHSNSVAQTTSTDENQQIVAVSPPSIKFVSDFKDISKTLTRRQYQLERRISRLERRSQKLRAISLGHVVSSQVQYCQQSHTVSSNMCHMSRLRRLVTYIDRRLDSEATQSSSGGESVIEEDSDSLHGLTAATQPERHWNTARAQLASRWTWLQAQVSELEYRIRQQTELYKKLRVGKVLVGLGDPEHVRQVSTSQVEQYNPTVPGISQSPRLPCLSANTNCAQPSSVIPDDGKKRQRCAPEDMCARVRPLVNFRKRKIMRTLGLHSSSRKARRLSSVKCHCDPYTLTPCVMCSGRLNPVQPVDTFTQNLNTRIALMDHTYHQILSFKTDKVQYIEFEQQLRHGDWHANSFRTRRLFSDEDHTLLAKKLLLKEQRQLLKSRAASFSKFEKTKMIRRRVEERKKRQAQLQAGSNLVKKKYETAKKLRSRSLDVNNKSVHSLRFASSFPSTIWQKHKFTDKLKQRFDINNIVIPSSMGAAHKIEVPQYKEIVTPLWREVVLSPCPIDTEDTPEELSESNIARRHLVMELQERHRFSSWVTGRGNTRRPRKGSGTATPEIRPVSPSCDTPSQTSPITCNLNQDDSSKAKFSISADHSVSMDTCEEEDLCLPVDPYPVRVFPLTSEQLEDMAKAPVCSFDKPPRSSNKICVDGHDDLESHKVQMTNDQSEQDCHMASKRKKIADD